MLIFRLDVIRHQCLPTPAVRTANSFSQEAGFKAGGKREDRAWIHTMTAKCVQSRSTGSSPKSTIDKSESSRGSSPKSSGSRWTRTLLHSRSGLKDLERTRVLVTSVLQTLVLFCFLNAAVVS